MKFVNTMSIRHTISTREVRPWGISSIALRVEVRVLSAIFWMSLPKRQFHYVQSVRKKKHLRPNREKLKFIKFALWEMIMFRKTLPYIAILVISGCQTSAEVNAQNNADLNARLERYNGASLAEFQSRTGMLPSDAYNVSEGRVFVFRTDPVFITLSATSVTPAITRTAQC